MFKSIGLILLISTFLGCSKTSDEVPSYIRVSKTSASSSSLGSMNSNIYALDISVENDARGTWEIPFLMPILKEGNKDLIIKPVIKQNNLSTLFEAYPLYKSKILNLNLIRGVEIDTALNFEYQDSVKIVLDEDMEIKNNFSSSSISSTAA